MPREHANNMVLGSVGYFMGQHRCKFGFALGNQDQAGVYPDKTARQRKGVDGIVIDGKKFETQARVTTVGSKLVADLIQIIVDFRIVQISSVGADFEHALFTDLAFLAWRNGGLRNITQIGQAFRTANE